MGITQQRIGSFVFKKIVTRLLPPSLQPQVSKKLLNRSRGTLKKDYYMQDLLSSPNSLKACSNLVIYALWRFGVSKRLNVGSNTLRQMKKYASE